MKSPKPHQAKESTTQRMNYQGKRAMKPLIKSKREKTKENQKQVSKKKFTWGPPDFGKSRGVVGVPTPGNKYFFLVSCP